MKNAVAYLSALFLAASVSNAQHVQLKSDAGNVVCSLNAEGKIDSLSFRNGDRTEVVRFRSGAFGGPSFGDSIPLLATDGSRMAYAGEKNGIRYSLKYHVGKTSLEIEARVENRTATDFRPARLPLVLGVDTYMDKFPEWNSKYFPTFFRCEKNSFWGYFMSPDGKILSVTSPDPVASYRIHYIPEMYGHLIHTVSLDLLCASPLPSHHPEQTGLKAGEARTWRICLSPVEAVDKITEVAAALSGTPVIRMDTYSVEPETAVGIGTAGVASDIEVTLPSGRKRQLGRVAPGEEIPFAETYAYGLYEVEARGTNGKTATASFYVRPPWTWYLQQARLQALVFSPRADKGNDSCETWYQLLGFYLAEKYFPDAALKAVADELLAQVLTTLFEEKDGKMYTKIYKERVQNVTAMISILSLKYSADKDLKTLETAAKCAEYILSRQHEQGYYGGYGMAHYTSVMYMAKSLLELADQIAPLAEKDEVWRDRHERYCQSAARAVEELSTRGHNVKTEGQSTYEDGAVSCSALQLIGYALRMDDGPGKERYLKAGLQYLQDHSCLTRLVDPDARSRAATSRFWECWGDIRTPMQTMLSPHGWSGWRMYAVYYAYLATGEEAFLRQLIDALGAGCQLISFPEGKLRYAFTPDPQLEGGVLVPSENNPEGEFRPQTMTAGYLEQIGNWFGKNTEGDGYLDRTHWSWDGAGTTFEIFKAMEESVVPNAFVCEKPGGGYTLLNCRLQEKGGKLYIRLSDRVIRRVHVNVKSRRTVVLETPDGHTVRRKVEGMQWVNL